jgi:hypothetical protein
MNDDKSWDRIVDAIDTRFGITKHGRTERKIADAMHLTEKVAFIEFERGGEPYRLERVTGPAIIDRRTVGARRAGAEVRFENVYDPDEIGHKTLMFKHDEGEWVAISPDQLDLG